VDTFKFNVTKFDFLVIIENGDSFFWASFWTKVDLTVVCFLKLIVSCNVISMIMSKENTFKLGVSSFEELIVFGDVILGVDDNGFSIGLNIIRVYGQTTNQHLFHIETFSLVGGLEHVLPIVFGLTEVVVEGHG